MISNCPPLPFVLPCGGRSTPGHPPEQSPTDDRMAYSYKVTINPYWTRARGEPGPPPLGGALGE